MIGLEPPRFRADGGEWGWLGRGCSAGKRAAASHIYVSCDGSPLQPIPRRVFQIFITVDCALDYQLYLRLEG
ncbi:unnamed protein product, partial [Closterium sp. NIES-53]